MSDIKQQVEAFSSKAEDVVDKIGQPLKPYIPLIARFLIVATFLEDALRIITQYSDQSFYMVESRGFPSFLSHLFLGGNVIVSFIIIIMIIYEKSEKKAIVIIINEK